MRNLRNTRHDRFTAGDASSSSGAPIAAAAWDPTDDSLYFATGPDEADHTITINRLSSTASTLSDATQIASWSAPPPNPSLTHDRILNLRAFPDDHTLVLILRGGDIVVIHTGTPTAEIEIAGSLDAGLVAAAWSPDEEVLALVAASDPAGPLLVMTRGFETLATVPLAAADVQVSAHVDVGWGKAETQFHGRGAAKAARRDPTLPDRVEAGVLSACDDGTRVAIAWRGDGEVFAVCAVLEAEPRRRIIRVYSREGVLEGVSEPVDGLEGALSWKPSGQLIAGVQRLQERVDVVFFERNGLRHGEFALRLDAEETATVGAEIELSWNGDSSVLAVAMRDRVQLWTMGNYHYYLKQEIRFDAPPLSSMAKTLWHPEKPLQLCAFNDSEIQRLAYNLEVCRGSVTAPNDHGLVAVIDGAVLKVTPLRIANIPPPMAFDEIQLPSAALDVAISTSGTEIAVLHSDRKVTRWACDYTGKPVKIGSILHTTAISGDASETVVVDQSENSTLIARTDHDRIYYESEPPMHDSSEDFTATVRYSVSGETTWHSPSGDQIVFKGENGALMIESEVQTLRIPSCTSFLVTPAHLIYTTGQHLLKFIHLHEGQLDIPADEPEKDERCRSIERGARIVTVMPSAYSLVLQMPRGNLETIYPRALVLAGVRRSLRAQDYRKAFSICRTHRVDMNLLHDYAPAQFMRDVDRVVTQLRKTEHVDLLLSSLTEEDVSQTIYRETIAPIGILSGHAVENGGMDVVGPPAGSKVNRICDAFLRVLGKDTDLRLQNIITAHVCKTPPDLEAGLRLVSGLRHQKDEARLEHAVEHISFLVDVNQLYETALGLYDLDVALLVAQQSQKDPREYLPYLQNLHEMPELEKRFAIDNDLKRFAKALVHLHSQENFEQLKLYMTKHDLYSVAIELYRYDHTRLTDLMRLYADHLTSRNRFKEAGIAYEYITDYSSAYEAFRSVGMWRECLSNAAAIPLSSDELSSLAQDLANSAEEAKHFDDAATIHLDYLSDLETAARLWCKGHHFAEAMRQITLRQQPTLLRTVLDPGLIESSAAMTELLAEMKSQLHAQVPRLRELREKKLFDPMGYLDGAPSTADLDLPDNLSVAASTNASTSAGTFLTRYTGTGITAHTNATRQTSKNRRREERKRARGKKGTVYEAEYLVNSIARLLERLNGSVGEDVGKLVAALLRRAMRERAHAVQSSFDELLQVCRAAVEEVWAKPTTETSEDVERGGMEGPTKEEGYRPVGGQGVLFDALAAPTREAPVLKAFERLGLLG